MVLGVQRQSLLVGVDAALNRLRAEAVIEPFDVVPLAGRQPIGARQGLLRVVITFVEEPEVVVDDREFRLRHRERRIDLDGALEQRRRLVAQPALMKRDALRRNSGRPRSTSW